jgi:hypothetical protein
MTNAHVYWMEWWRRQESPAPQRGQYPGLPAAAGRSSKLQVSHETSPAWAAVRAAAVIALVAIGVMI